MISVDKLIEMKHPTLKNKIKEAFEDSTNSQVEEIKISYRPEIPINVETGESRTGHMVYTIKLYVPLKE